MTAEEMRQAILELIQGWLTHSTAQQSEAAMNVLNALAGDIQMIRIDKK